MEVIPAELNVLKVDPLNLSKESVKTLKRELSDKAPSAARLSQVLAIKMCGCGVSINWAHPESLRLGNMDEGVTYRLLNYAHCEPLNTFLHLKNNGGIWESSVTTKR